MPLRRWWMIAAASLAACGGSSAAPGTPSDKGVSHVTVEAEGAKHDVTGPAFARLDTGQNALLVFTFRSDTDPAPSCELIASPSTMKRGGFVSFAVTGFSGAPGNYPVSQAAALLGDAEKGDLSMFSATVATTSISVRSFGSDAFSGEVTATGGAPKVVGSVSGRVCPSVQTTASNTVDAPPLDAPEKPPPVVPKLDTDGVAGMTLGMSVKKLPKGTSKKPRAPKQAREVSVYDAKGVLYMGEPIVSADIAVVSGTVMQIAASVGHCDGVLAKLKERYGEGGTTALDGQVWRGTKTELTLVPFKGGTCLVTFAKIQAKPTTPSAL